MEANFQTFKLNDVSRTRGKVPAVLGAYLITCKPTGQIYVGSTAGKGGLRYRISRHLSYLRAGRHISKKLQAVFNKYGEDAFWVSLLEEVPDPGQCKVVEQKYLDDLKPFGKRGFNKLPRAQSRLGVQHTAAAKARMSAARNARSEEWKRKATEASRVTSREMWNRPGFRDNIVAKLARPFRLEKDGKVFEGKNLAAFARMTGLSQGPLSEVAAGKLHCYKGWTLPGKSLLKRKVVSPTGQIFELTNTARFSREHGLTQSSLNRVMLGKAKQHKGWKCVGEPGPCLWHTKN